MRRLLLGAVIVSIACGSASAASRRNYWQGVCDGLRASEKYPTHTKLAVIGHTTAGKSEYFACNGDDPSDSVVTVTVVRWTPANGNE